VQAADRWVGAAADCKELSRIVVTVLSLFPSSCVVERSFSRQENIHSRLRNRLEDSKEEKLMCLY
jgi:hypothetical protein